MDGNCRGMYENYRKINLIQDSHPPREILGERENALSNQLVYSSMNRNVIASRFFFFFLDKQGYPDFFEYLTISLDICSPPSHTHRVITKRNPMGVALSRFL